MNDFSKDEFVLDTELTTDVYSNVKLQNENEVINLYFSNIDNPNDSREKANVVVKHNYKFTSFVIEDGNRVEKIQTGFVQEGITDVYYVGQTFKATPNTALLAPLAVEYKDAVPGLEIKLVRGENVINLNYEGENDLTIPAKITVNHYYKTIDLNGTIFEAESLVTASNSYAGVEFTATPDFKGTETLENPFEVQNNPDELTIILKEGENVINIYYERTIDTRETASIKVVHKYYGYDTRIDPEKANKIEEGTFEENFTAVDEGAWIGNQFNATLRTTVTDGEKTVQYVLDPEDQVKSIIVGAEGNEITLIYSRDYQSPTPPVDPEEPIDPEEPTDSENPREPEETSDEPIIEDTEEIIEEEDIPGGEIPIEETNTEETDIEDEEIDLEDEEIPGGATELPDTGGLPTEIFYGLGALAIMTGVLFKFKRKEENM